MDINDVQLQKAVLWEEAKGKLRAMVTADGHKRCVPVRSRTLEEDRAAHKAWEKRKNVVEDFIKEFENNGYHE